MKTRELQSLTVKELHKQANGLGLKDFSGLKKQELIISILEVQAKNKGAIYGEGVLEVMSDGYGFLRSSDYSYLPGPDDIYVSHSQIKRFRLKTGHMIAGQIRPPKDKERFFALLRVEQINGINPEESKGLVHFDNLTPLYPEELIKLETSDGGISARTIDMLAPVGKGQRGLIVAQPKTGKLFYYKKLPTLFQKMLQRLI